MQQGRPRHQRRRSAGSPCTRAYSTQKHAWNIRNRPVRPASPRRPIAGNVIWHRHLAPYHPLPPTSRAPIGLLPTLLPAKDNQHRRRTRTPCAAARACARTKTDQHGHSQAKARSPRSDIARSPMKMMKMMMSPFSTESPHHRFHLFVRRPGLATSTFIPNIDRDCSMWYGMCR